MPVMELEKPKRDLIWKPHEGPQEQFLRLLWVYEGFFGGSKGPGKTDALLMEGLRQIEHPDYKAIIFRRTYPKLQEIIDRSYKWFPGMGAKYDKQLKRWTFPSGATYKFGHVQREMDKYDYQGHEYHYMGFDQLEEFTETQYLFLIAQNRVSVKGIRCYVRSTANPGNIGHMWVKNRFMDKMAPGKVKYFKRLGHETVETTKDDPKGSSRVFIPATLDDNPTLLKNDPDYEKRLEMQGEKDYKALRWGDWNIFTGQFFSEWTPSIHVCRPRALAPEKPKFISIDYGFGAPASVGWWEVGFEGKLTRYRELYIERKTYKELALLILQSMSMEENILYAVGDPAIWGDKKHHDSNEIEESGGEIMEAIFQASSDKIMQERLSLNIDGRMKFPFIKADNRRKEGWDLFREYLKITVDQHGQMSAKLEVFDTCVDFIRTVPALIHDLKKPDDLDTHGEDHAADDSRYGLMSRQHHQQEESIGICTSQGNSYQSLGGYY